MADNEKNSVILGASVAMGITGAIVGGTIAAVRDLKEVKTDKKTKNEAVKNILKESAGSGISAAAGTVLVGNLKISHPILGGLSFAAATIGTKYLFDRITSQPEQQVEEIQPQEDSEEKEEVATDQKINLN